MARLRRLYLPGVPSHVWVRGNNKQAIFRSEGDRVYFHRCLVEATRRLGVAVHAYVLMGNHFHLLATGASPDSISKMVQSMGRRYVSYFNYLHERTGTLWEGRFQSCPVETERYLLVCHQYVEMNPVRAGMIDDPGRYPWSSHGCNALGREDDLVTPHSLYMELGAAERERRTRYRALFGTEIDPLVLAAIRYSAGKGWALGGDRFCEKLEELSGRPAVPRKAGRPKGKADRPRGSKRGAAGEAGAPDRKIPELAQLESDPDYWGQGTACSREVG